MTVQKIGRYEIKSELGRGGMATVYKAYDPRFEREVALKVLPREMLHDDQFRVRFEREAKTIALLEHPSIVPVYDVGEEDGQPYFVMRCMTGGSLADMLEKGPLSLKESAKIMSRIAGGLDDAHIKGIVHRDLKPGNILFDRGGEPYVSDFGIAKMTQSQGVTVTGGAIIGTPAYMSPEQAQGEKVDGRSDVYALGVILFEMLSGQQPYQATTPMAVVVKHITEPVPHILDVRKDLPTDVELIIEKAMAKNVDERFATAGEFAAALSAVAEGQGAQDALKTAALSTREIAQKTRIARQKMLDDPTVAATGKSAGAGIPVGVWIGIGVAALLLFVAVGAGAFFIFGSPAAPEPTPTQPVAEVSPTEETAQSTVEDPTPTAEIVEPTATPEPTEAPVARLPGNAEKIAFVANSEIWMMNPDGSDLRQLTSDKFPKTDLQWVPPAYTTLVFISGKNVNTIDTANGDRFDTIASFPNAEYVDAFRLSPDGTQVAISLNREMYIVPFDIEALRGVRGKSGLIAMEGCINYTGATQAAVAVKDFRWADDGKIIAWLFSGVEAGSSRAVDLIRVLDISSCQAETINRLDEFPGTRFAMEGYGNSPLIPDFDFDGSVIFLLNSNIRNNGWGHLYEYNTEVRKANQIDPFGLGTCCYRDARWSPDKNYIIFAFQDRLLGADAPTLVYYIPYTSLGLTTDFTPLPLPEGFFTNLREAPQFSLRPPLP